MIDSTFVCLEKYGPKLRHAVEVEPTLEVEKYLREHLPPAASPMKDVTHIYSYGTRLILIDDVGMVFQGNIEFDGMYDVHIGFWDRVLRGREDMCRSLAQQAAEDLGARGVWTAIPEASRATLAFAKRVGFLELRRSGSTVVLALLVT